MYREHTKVISIGDKKIGGGNPILIQSMTNTPTENVEETVKQILELEAAGCEIIRCTVPTLEAAKAVKEIKKQIHIPLVADIHFDYKMAIAAMENGADKIRINPGNIGGRENSGSGRHSERTKYPNSRRGKQRLSGKGTGGKISRCNSRRPGGERP